MSANHPPHTSGRALSKHFGNALLGLALCSCAFISPVQPGMTRDEVAARLGSPTRVVPLKAGTRLQYAAGQRAYMVDLNAAGQVVQSRQVLNANDFARIDIGKWTRQDVEREFGPPAYVDRVASWPGNVMNYRWREFEDLLFWVYLDDNNVVQRTGQGLDLSRDPPPDRSN